MANAEAWNLGAQMGAGRAAHERDRKEMLADEHRQLTVTDLHAKAFALANEIKALPEGSPERKKKELALANAKQSLHEVYDPIRNPGALHKDWDFLVGLITRKKPVAVNIGSYDPVTSADVTITPEAQSITLAPGEQPITLPSAPVTIPGTTSNVRPAASAMTPQQRQRMAHRDQARAEAAQDVEAAGLTPEQEQTAQARADVAGSTAKIDGLIRWGQQAGIPFTDQEITSMRDAAAGIGTKAAWKVYVSPDGKMKRSFDLNRPETVPPDWSEEGSQKAETLKQDEYNQAVRNGYTGSYLRWQSEQRAPSSKFGINVESYKRMHGIPAEQALTPQQLNFVEQQIALSSAAPSTTITNTLKQNAEGWWVPIQESNRRVPGIGVILSDPLGGAAAPNGAAAPSGAAAGTEKPAANVSQTMVTPQPRGLITAGNLPIWNRPVVQNGDGTHSTEYSVSFADQQGHEVLVPTVVNGRFLTPDGTKPQPGSPEEKAMFQAAWQHYLKSGEHLGIFDNVADANAYSKLLHNRRQDAPHGAHPHPAPGATAQPRGGADASVRVGKPLFAAPNKDYTETKAAYQGAVDRATTMDKNYRDGLKGDQQAMLSLTANHIGMTLGAQKGSRINQAVWNEATESAPWLAKARAHFDGRGYLSGVVLTPDQMAQMVNLAHEKVQILADHLGRIREELHLDKNNDTITMQLPDGRTGPIHATQKNKFIHDHPGAVEVTSGASAK